MLVARLSAALVGSVLLGVALTGVAACAEEPEHRPTDRMVNLGFEDVINEDPSHLVDLAERLEAVDATAVSISVGRTDWTAFPWPGQTDAISDEVSRTGRDFVGEAISALAKNGKERDVILTIDVLLGRALSEDPSLAGRNIAGERSKAFASVSSLRHGKAGARLASLAAAVAKKYRPTAVNLTELMFDDFTFGSEDFDDFKATTGEDDWPRNREGGIDQSDARISTWRSEAMADIVRRVGAAVDPYGVRLEMDVRSPRDSPSADRADSGHDYDLLLKQLDRLHVWEYVGINAERSPQTKDLAKALTRRAGSRMSLSVGLWSDDGTISPERFETALREAARGGATSVSVTPASLMTAGHWEVLRNAWAR
ncbi:hypothetical protein KSW38_00875 [Paenarthrobacter sp. MMS21-TAE1-1]|uniref:Uncharacterized protein n=2 Tax=Paenarthrobacter aromaticivorans TaxID=2849150 RepID=A0ABS6I1E6_9MICC|nr:hypothetical protein [Paenarthrobacter sp. MMS21-TAE1-1]